MRLSAETFLARTPKPLLLVLSGPSGVGKDAVLTQMKRAGLSLTYIITMTTRSRRPRERNNIDYHFVSTDEFQSMMRSGGLLEWANVYGNWYGVPKKPVKEALDAGQDVIVKVDTQGALSIKKIVPQAVFIFLMPPSLDELMLRLEQRHTENTFDLALRIKTAEEEIRQLPSFDYLVFNRRDRLAEAVSDIKAIITAEKSRVAPREITL